MPVVPPTAVNDTHDMPAVRIDDLRIVRGGQVLELTVVIGERK